MTSTFRATAFGEEPDFLGKRARPYASFMNRIFCISHLETQSNSANKSAHTIPANARLFHYEPSQNNHH